MRHTPTILDARIMAGSGGGPEKTLINSPRYLEPAGYRMLCAYLHPPGDPGFDALRLRAGARGVDLLSIPDRGPADWGIVRSLIDLCRRERVAVWHGHDYKTDALGLLLARFHPMRLVATVHGWVDRTWKMPLYYAVDRWSLRRYEKVICVSTDLVDACLGAGVRRDRCLLLENGIDLGDYQRRRGAAEARAELGLPNRQTIGAVGRLAAEKGFDILIRAVDRLLATGLDVQLLIAGDGPHAGSLKELIATLGRGDRIELIGHRGDLTALYEAMDVFALSSYREGLPNVLLEAMAMRVPVVATRVNGVPRLIAHDVSGALVTAGSVDELEASLRRVLGDGHLQERYASAGRDVIEARFSFAERMAKLARIYDDMQLQEG